jgi:hypothetical protein
VFNSPKVAADYVASPGQGLDLRQVDADGLAGSVQFSAALLPVAGRTTDPDADRLTGTFEWTCASTPSQ